MLKLNELRIENLKDYAFTDNKNPRFTLTCESDEENAFSTAYRITVESDGTVFWDSKKVLTDKTTNIIYDGDALKANTYYTVKAEIFDNFGNRSSKTAHFETGKLGTKWFGNWITHPTYSLGLNGNPPGFVFKKEFSCIKKVKSARIYVTAMGVYTVRLNGERVGDYFLAPGYTSYKNNLQYQSYDIKPLLKENNTILLTVAGGWACGEFGLLRQNKAFADKPSLLCEVIVTYDDKTEIIPSDNKWLVSTDGPVRDASIYDGEIYDSRKNIEEADFVNCAKATMGVFPKIQAEYGMLPQKVDLLKPVTSHIGKNGIIFDFGQNFAGVVHIKADAKKGQIITVRHAEVLIEGELFTKPLRSAKARFQYICRDGVQEYNPEYTYMGFRYIEVRGIREQDIEVSGIVLSSVTEKLGSFVCSNEDINRLEENIIWGGRSNFMDIPTDCPQRDERLGWTGDIAVFASTACYNFNMSRFLEKWLTDVMSEQTCGGAIPVVVPHVKFLQKLLTAGWSDCCILVPWALYLSTGDESILKQFYPMMKKYLQGVKKKSGLLSLGKHKYIWSAGFSYGDWCAPNEKQIQWMSKKKWISTAYFANSCNIMSKIAKAIGNVDDSLYYENMYQKISSAYRQVFTDGNGKIGREFQTAYVCPLYFGMTKERETENYVKNLHALVEKADNHLTTGFLGTPYLLFALSDNDCAKKAYDVLLQDTCPSWLYEVKAGGTTIWERWDALRPDGTVNLGEAVIENADSAYGGGMVSFNHYANGAVGDWLYRRVAGIEQTKPGYKEFKIQPIIDERLTFAKSEKETLYGKIKSEWQLENGDFTLNAQVPFNTKAKIILPNGETYEVGSGKYTYNCKIDA